jgi:hypothetical protein|tara:strand:- start:584 stop:1240 length:657 start_codon:yes stop_codon:yes gene_type:complete
MNPFLKFSAILFLWLTTSSLFAQQYESKEGRLTTIVQIMDGYYTEVVFEENPPKFMSARGGFISNNTPNPLVNLEYNSLFEQDSLTTISLAALDAFVIVAEKPQALDGQWLMGGRMRNGEISYRDTSGPRKTLKVLFNGHFQWMAFNTDTFAFMGTGGGNYSSVDGIYKEEIKFFSRDDSRVGAILPFDYELISGEWHHKGKSSKGGPIHEIWIQREY